MKKIFFVFFAFAFVSMSMLTSCEDDFNSSFSKKNHVYCFFNSMQYPQLHNAMGNPGQYVSIRQRVLNGTTKIEMTSSIGSEQYMADALSVNFTYGLGGLIVGTNFYGEYLAYDLACSNCDRADRRLNINDNGTAICGKCGIVYDLNNYGVISAVEGDGSDSPRNLYRYRINYDGTNVIVHN